MRSKDHGVGQNRQAEVEIEQKLPRRAPADQLARAADQPHTLEEPMSQNPSSSQSKKPEGMLDRSLQAQIGRQLRAIYSDVSQENVPDRFVRLLEALEAKEKQS